MPKRASTKRKSQEKSISAYFKKEEVPEQEKVQSTSPGKTSDYESDPSRSNSPSEESKDVAKVVPKNEESPSENSEAIHLDVKREVKQEESEEDNGELDIFAQTGENEDDNEDIKAAVTSGLLSADVKKEEERMAEETARFERQEEAKRSQLLLKEQQELSKVERFKKLMSLLNKSKIYSEFLMKKMKSHEAGIKLKQKTVEERNQKRAEKADTLKPAQKGNKRGRKNDEEEESQSKKRKLDAPDSATNNQKDVAKTRSENQRKFEGKEIPENQPLLLSGGIMRSYQLEGYEWMATLWEKGINGILADEMGLGKTIQTVALFCHLYEMGVPGPFLVVAPLSTVPNWVNEFKRFAPTVPVVLYHGSLPERMELRSKLRDSVTSNELDGKKMMNVIVTSYEIAMNDRAAFSSIRWRYIVVDEGHRLKNMNCRLIRELKQYNSANRLLLTGTPLQNNLSELWSLLNFLLPEIFDDLRVFESWFDAKDIHEKDEERTRITDQEQNESILSTLHQILTPFLLRRVKSDVDLEIPPKKEVLVYCPLTARQRELYRAIVEKTLADLLQSDEEKDEKKELPAKRKRTEIDYSVFLDEKEFKNDEKFEEHLQKLQEAAEAFSQPSSTGSAYVKELERLASSKEKNFSVKSRMMDMRKCVNHPYMIEYPITEDGMFYDSGPDMVDICGKLQVFDQMIVKLVADGHKTLVFSQMTKMLDILGDYCNFKKWKFCRLGKYKSRD